MITNDDGTLTVEESDLKEDNDQVEVEKISDEKVKKDLQTAIAKKKAWRDKAVDPDSKKTYKELYEELKKAPQDTKKDRNEKPVDNDLRADVESLKMESQKRTFQYANKLSPEQVDHVFAYAKGMNITPKDALETQFVKKAIEQMKLDDDNSNAMLSPSKKAPVFKGNKSFAQLSPEERKQAFESTFKKN